MSVTQNEHKVLRSLITNDFDGDTVWANCVNDSREPSGLEGKSLAGVVSSLAKKGLVLCQGRGRDAVIVLTDQGTTTAK